MQSITLVVALVGAVASAQSISSSCTPGSTVSSTVVSTLAYTTTLHLLGDSALSTSTPDSTAAGILTGHSSASPSSGLAPMMSESASDFLFLSSSMQTMVSGPSSSSLPLVATLPISVASASGSGTLSSAASGASPSTISMASASGSGALNSAASGSSPSTGASDSIVPTTTMGASSTTSAETCAASLTAYTGAAAVFRMDYVAALAIWVSSVAGLVLA